MKPRITFFLGSPREHGNTACLIDKVSETLKKKGANPKTVFLPDYKIKPCAECFSCQKTAGKPGCKIKDDMQEMYEKILASSVIVFAAPVFFWSYAAQIKPFIDRLFCLGKYDKEPIASLVKGKKCALVLTAGGDEFDGADLVVQSFARMAEFSQMNNLGHLVIGEYTAHEMLDRKETAHKIEAFAEKLLNDEKKRG
ncbi:MAG TPA: NAD(P)H-dependent oxidoreductase [Desulfomonilia bacterium]